jgi:hypothetical protein
MADAQRAGLVKEDSGYRKHPSSMLRARASSNLARMVYPDVLSGCYLPDEIDEIRTPEQVTAIAEERRQEATTKALDAITAAAPPAPAPAAKVARQARTAPIVEARQRLDAADTPDKLDDLAARIEASAKLTPEEKATLQGEIAEKRAAPPPPAEPSAEEVARAEAGDRADQAAREQRRSRT